MLRLMAVRLSDNSKRLFGQRSNDRVSAAAAHSRTSRRRLQTLVGQRPLFSAFRNLFVSEAIDRVVVHHPDCLHEGVTDRGAHELEPSAQQVPAQGVGLWRPGRDLPERSPAVHARRPANTAPYIGVETSELVLDRKEGF